MERMERMERMKRMIGDICGQRQKALRRHPWLGQIIKTTHCSQAQLIQLKIVHEIWRLLASSVIRDQQWLIIEAYNSSKGCDGPSASQVGWEEFSKVQHNTILKTISESEPMLTWLGQGRLTTSTSYDPARPRLGCAWLHGGGPTWWHLLHWLACLQGFHDEWIWLFWSMVVDKLPGTKGTTVAMLELL